MFVKKGIVLQIYSFNSDYNVSPSELIISHMKNMLANTGHSTHKLTH